MTISLDGFLYLIITMPEPPDPAILTGACVYAVPPPPEPVPFTPEVATSLGAAA